jgi:ribosomal protein RSM22 (predicted rRNA methylase)
MPDRRITSLLDLGAGPGTAGWAALEVFDEVQQITLVEQDTEWIRTGKSLARTGENVVLAHADWVHANLRAVASFPAHDLVVSSYALGEIAPKVAREIVKAAWAAAGTAIVIIEPGTMRGFELMRVLRDDLIALGGHVIAPCPHQDTCPIPTNDWCHFAQRFARSALHRRLKIGTLGYEDEKFSYIVASKHLSQPVKSRVIRHPLRHSGHTRLRLCTGDGLQTITVTRSNNEHWPRARKSSGVSGGLKAAVLIMISPYTSTAYVVTGYEGNGQKVHQFKAGWVCWLPGLCAAWQEEKQRQRGEKHDPKDQARSL